MRYDLRQAPSAVILHAGICVWGGGAARAIPTATEEGEGREVDDGVIGLGAIAQVSSLGNHLWTCGGVRVLYS